MDNNYHLLDKYSVISDERREEMGRQQEKRRESQRRRQVQVEIGEELSRKAKDDYGDDILDCLLESEVWYPLSNIISRTKRSVAQNSP